MKVGWGELSALKDVVKRGGEGWGDWPMVEEDAPVEGTESEPTTDT